MAVPYEMGRVHVSGADLPHAVHRIRGPTLQRVVEVKPEPPTRQELNTAIDLSKYLLPAKPSPESIKAEQAERLRRFYA